MQLIVLGMHRSGTSPVTRLLNMMGAYFGPEGISTGANKENPKGFWERRDIRKQTDAVLQELGVDWCRVSNFDLEKISRDSCVAFQETFRKILLDLDAHRPWVIKDPRLCLLFPLWRPLLEVPVCVHVHRSPVEVAHSLKTRNGFPINFGIALWELYNLSALKASLGLPRVLVSYNQVMADPVAAVERLHANLTQLGVQGLRLPSQAEISAFIDQSLYRERAAPDLRSNYLNEMQARLVDALKDGTAFAIENLPALSKGAEKALVEFETKALAQTSAATLEKELQARVAAVEERDGQIGELERTVAEAQKELQARVAAVEERDGRIGELERTVAEAQKELQARVAAVEERDGRIGELERTVAEAQKELQARVAAVEDSAGEVGRELETLARYIDGVDNALNVILTSKRWRAGYILGELFYKVVPSPFKGTLWTVGRTLYRFIAPRLPEDQGPWATAEIASLRPRVYEILAKLDRAHHHARARSEPHSAITRQLRTEGHVEKQSSFTGFDKTLSVDVVICVHNALDDVKACLNSVVDNTSLPHTLYIVNDGSDKETSDCLREFSAKHANCTLLENSVAQGYPKAANRGLRASTADCVVLLNSDTIVPEYWLERLLECGESDPRIGIVGPLSNAASWQSVPERFSSAGDWEVNRLPSGFSVDDMAQVVSELSEKRFPRVPLLNGFCLAIKRAVIEKIGYFDEEAFPFGYGEENDYCLRAADAGFALAVADHTYIYHAKSKSYTHEGRKALAKQGGEALGRKYPGDRISRATNALRHESTLAYLRDRVAEFCEAPLGSSVSSRDTAFRVLFLLPTRGGGGGAHSVVQEAKGMRMLGADARVAIRNLHRRDYERVYPQIAQPGELFYCYDSVPELVTYAAEFQVVIATIYHSTELLKDIAEVNPHVTPGYYVQDYEPWFFDEGSPEWAKARRSYTLIPDTVLFAKTRWLCEMVEREHGVKAHKVSASLDHDVYYPSVGRREKSSVNVVAMIRPSTPRRAPERTMRVLKKLKQELGDAVSVHTFGCDGSDKRFLELAQDFEFRNHGVLTREGVAALLRASDIFVDLSDYQAFGRTGLEAIACGAAVALPVFGGVHEYAVHLQNALLVDTRSEDSCYAAIKKLATNTDLRDALRHNGLHSASKYSIERAAKSEIIVLRAQFLTTGQLRNIAKRLPIG